MQLLEPALCQLTAVKQWCTSFPSMCPGTHLASCSTPHMRYTLPWSPFRSQPRHIPKTLKISCKTSLGCASRTDQSCACCKSWEANGPTDSLQCVAAHANEFRVLLQWMAIKEGLMKSEPVGMDSLCGCEESWGTAKGVGRTSFSRSITLEGARLLSSALLPSFAQGWTDLALYIWMGLLPPL